MSVSPARRAALRTLARIRQRDSYATESINAALAEAGLSEREHAFASRLVSGAVQTAGVLDEAIDRFANRPTDLEPQVRDALRLAAYEILFMRTPDWAAVNEAVEAVRRVRPQAAGVANAVLRRLSEAAPDFPWGEKGSEIDTLARATGHPAWIARLLSADLGADEARAVLTEANEPAPLYLWHNPFLGTLDEAITALEQDGAAPEACVPDGCLVARNAAAAVRGGALAAGRVLVTDAAAQLAARALAPLPGERIVEIAAGRGTKTAQIQALAYAHGGPANVWALDVHEFKTSILRDRLGKLGVPGVTPLAGDGSDLAAVGGLPAAGTVDSVLVDAPCSGLGTLRRRLDKRWRLAPQDIESLAALQGALLREAATLVRPGGVVVYSTCSLARSENHEVVSGFLREGAGTGFRTRSLADVVPAEWSRWLTPEGWFQSVPRLGGPDGHFVAALERTG